MMTNRVLKRVPLNFNWPLNEIWKGYTNPYSGMLECNACQGIGYNPKTKIISDAFYDFENTNQQWYHKITQGEVKALIDAGRLMDFTHNWTPEKGWVKKEPKYIPTADEVNRWSKQGMGHDAINRSILIKARARRLGVWGYCIICKGNGEIKNPNHQIYLNYKKWKEYEPPKGKGYQCWETVSEGSPISPVFKTISGLCQWMADNPKGVTKEFTEEDWMKTLKGDSIGHDMATNKPI